MRATPLLAHVAPDKPGTPPYRKDAEPRATAKVAITDFSHRRHCNHPPPPPSLLANAGASIDLQKLKFGRTTAVFRVIRKRAMNRAFNGAAIAKPAHPTG
jgi:hypothetical protein